MPVRPKSSNQRTSLQAHLGAGGTLVGELSFIRQGRRELSQFQYAASWLADANRFELSPDLPLVAGYQTRKAPSAHDSVFHLAIADTVPDARLPRSSRQSATTSARTQSWLTQSARTGPTPSPTCRNCGDAWFSTC